MVADGLVSFVIDLKWGYWLLVWVLRLSCVVPFGVFVLRFAGWVGLYGLPASFGCSGFDLIADFGGLRV